MTNSLEFNCILCKQSHSDRGSALRCCSDFLEEHGVNLTTDSTIEKYREDEHFLIGQEDHGIHGAALIPARAGINDVRVAVRRLKEMASYTFTDEIATPPDPEFTSVRHHHGTFH